MGTLGRAAQRLDGLGGGMVGLPRIVWPGTDNVARPDRPLADQPVEIGDKSTDQLQFGGALRERAGAPGVLGGDRQALRAPSPRPVLGGGECGSQGAGVGVLGEKTFTSCSYSSTGHSPGSASHARKLSRGARQAVRDQLLRLLVQLA
jgi:hypothetical protein